MPGTAAFSLQVAAVGMVCRPEGTVPGCSDVPLSVLSAMGMHGSALARLVLSGRLLPAARRCWLLELSICLTCQPALLQAGGVTTEIVV